MIQIHLKAESLRLCSSLYHKYKCPRKCFSTIQLWSGVGTSQAATRTWQSHPSSFREWKMLDWCTTESWCTIQKAVEVRQYAWVKDPAQILRAHSMDLWNWSLRWMDILWCCRSQNHTFFFCWRKLCARSRQMAQERSSVCFKWYNWKGVIYVLWCIVNDVMSSISGHEVAGFSVYAGGICLAIVW